MSGNEVQHHADHGRRNAGGVDQRSRLGAPIGEYGRNRNGGNDQKRIGFNKSGRDEPLLAVDRTGHNAAAEIRREHLGEQGGAGEILAHQSVDVRKSRKYRSVPMVKSYGSAASQGDRGHEVLKDPGRNAAGDDANEPAVRVRDLAGEDDRLAVRYAALDRFDHKRGRSRSGLEGLEISAIREVDRWRRPPL